jgi:hypothetical protein
VSSGPNSIPEQDLGLSPEIIATALGVEKRSVIRWRSGNDYPRTRVRSALAELYELHDRLLHTFSPEDVRDWLREPNESVAGLSPLELLRAGRIDRVAAALYALESGVFL